MEHVANPYGLGLEQEVNRLVDPNPLWARAFAEEAARILTAVGEKALAIEHYGSTAVPNLRAKPIIDLQIGVADIDHGLLFIEPMASLGYDYAGGQGIPDHHIFGKGRARTHSPTWSSTRGTSGCAPCGSATACALNQPCVLPMRH
jgi:GrpB-like predicted nucleotidyltransferase (UPF0157 family)